MQSPEHFNRQFSEIEYSPEATIMHRLLNDVDAIYQGADILMRNTPTIALAEVMVRDFTVQKMSDETAEHVLRNLSTYIFEKHQDNQLQATVIDKDLQLTLEQDSAFWKYPNDEPFDSVEHVVEAMITSMHTVVADNSPYRLNYDIWRDAGISVLELLAERNPAQSDNFIETEQE